MPVNTTGTYINVDGQLVAPGHFYTGDFHEECPKTEDVAAVNQPEDPKATKGKGVKSGSDV